MSAKVGEGFGSRNRYRRQRRHVRPSGSFVASFVGPRPSSVDHRAGHPDRDGFAVHVPSKLFASMVAAVARRPFALSSDCFASHRRNAMKAWAAPLIMCLCWGGFSDSQTVLRRCASTREQATSARGTSRRRRSVFDWLLRTRIVFKNDIKRTTMLILTEGPCNKIINSNSPPIDL